MKSIIHHFKLAILLVAIAGNGCKNGKPENQLPELTRDSKLMREWKLKGFYRKFKVSYPTPSTTTWTLKGKDLIIESQTPGIIKDFSIEMHFEKNGTLTVTESADGKSTFDKTFWAWMDSDEKKSQLYMNLSAANWVMPYMKVRELNANQLVLEFNQEFSRLGSPTNETQEEIIKIEFEPKN